MTERRGPRLPGTPRSKNPRACPLCGRMHFMGGRCEASKGETGPIYAPEAPGRLGASRAQLWGVVDASRTLLSRARSGRIGSTAYELAADALELALARLPPTAWEKQ